MEAPEGLALPSEKGEVDQQAAGSSSIVLCSRWMETDCPAHMDSCLSCLVRGVLEEEVTLSDRPPSCPHAPQASSFSAKATALACRSRQGPAGDPPRSFSDVATLPAVPVGAVPVPREASLQSVSQSHLTQGSSYP